ncbi:hypothetical protein MSG28_004193 [Choristoneura fumiferana]|uniref:Uncharacterized protein n=1 Tax=Choristoneura fumiferana TaxID=7141 RepID=A0ACC0KJ12_CHOFU|nr:hypothetical protein MSG28_004193 [Choristoneura fumiferana]
MAIHNDYRSALRRHRVTFERDATYILGMSRQLLNIASSSYRWQAVVHCGVLWPLVTIGHLPANDADDDDDVERDFVLAGGASARAGAVVLVVAGGAGVSARVAGKVGGYSNKMSGKSTSGINEEIIWISISMAIAIAEFARHALADSLADLEFPPYTLYPQYSPDGKEYFYNFHRFSYLRNSFKLPPKDYPIKDSEEVYINA